VGADHVKECQIHKSCDAIAYKVTVHPQNGHCTDPTIQMGSSSTARKPLASLIDNSRLVSSTVWPLKYSSPNMWNQGICSNSFACMLVIDITRHSIRKYPSSCRTFLVKGEA
jgi:hypothetical protein